VVDVGCGPGHVTAFLAGCGLAVAGLGLSFNPAGCRWR
jgi:2-polyprenyl-3-methyl-5-hydroxy-6-metoxy-1,4-benzoquinol methylase